MGYSVGWIMDVQATQSTASASITRQTTRSDEAGEDSFSKYLHFNDGTDHKVEVLKVQRLMDVCPVIRTPDSQLFNILSVGQMVESGDDAAMSPQQATNLSHAYEVMNDKDRRLMQAATGLSFGSDQKFHDATGAEVTPTDSQMRWITNTAYTLAAGRAGDADRSAESGWNDQLTPDQFRDLAKRWQGVHAYSGRPVEEAYNQNGLKYLNAVFGYDNASTASPWLAGPLKPPSASA